MIRHGVVVARDTPASRADVWGSLFELWFSGTVVAARPELPLEGGVGQGRTIEGQLPNGTPATLRLWFFAIKNEVLGDWDDMEGTREMLRRLRTSGKVRILLQREDESVGELWLRVRQLIGAVGD